MNASKLISIVQLVVVLLALCFAASANAAPITVDLEVDDSGSEKVLKVKNDGITHGNSSWCGAPEKDSCILVEEGKKPFIIFKLPHACTDSDDDPGYGLSGFRITQVNNVWPTRHNPLNATVAADFSANPDTGIPDFNTPKFKLKPTRIKFKNWNSHAYTVFYEVTAQPCDSDSDDDDLHLDPQIRNRGN